MASDKLNYTRLSMDEILNRNFIGFLFGDIVERLERMEVRELWLSNKMLKKEKRKERMRKKRERWEENRIKKIEENWKIELERKRKNRREEEKEKERVTEKWEGDIER